MTMMMISKKAIPRRMVLRGLGASLALPLLDGMVPALSALSTTAATPTVRFGAVYVPNGMVMQNWTPAASGRVIASRSARISMRSVTSSVASRSPKRRVNGRCR